MRMNTTDEYDIRESFAALDDDKLGFLELDALYVLYLGLGYPYMDKDELKKELEQPSDGPQHVTVDKVLEFLSNKTRDREAEMNACFSTVDTDSKGFITPADIVKLSEAMGTQDGGAFSVEYAETMLELSQSQNCTPGCLDQYDFEKLFAPPSS